MTPAVTAANKAKIEFQLHEYAHDPGSESYGLEAAEKLGVDPSRVFKTLVVELDNGTLAVAIVPVAHQLNLKAMAKAVKAKKAAMADPKKVQNSTGYVLGGVSPLGQKRRLQTIVDASAQAQKTIFVSGGRRGLEIELTPGDLISLTAGQFSSVAG